MPAARLFGSLRPSICLMLFLGSIGIPPVAKLFAHEGEHDHGTAHHEGDETPGLPRVLILGDSISIGYTPFVREKLQGVANVYRPDDNCSSTTYGLAKLDEWLADGHWDLIHFNFGLHDLKHVNEKGEPVAVDAGRRQVAAELYEQQLEAIVQRLQQTGAKLVWCSTTPIPAGASARMEGSEVEYNRIAQNVIRRVLGEDRVTNDLHSAALAKLTDIQQPANVHFTEDGSRYLAERVATVIQQQLQGPVAIWQKAQGVVYHDRNGNQRFDEGDSRLPDVRVSNGRQIVSTNAQGEYSIPVEDNSFVFVIKPRGFRTPVDEKQLPLFYYNHKPNGSRPTEFAGVKPTGPLPASIDFPLYPQQEPEQFQAILFGDPQPRSQQEVDYIAHDVVEELVGTEASFGVTLGDITFDNLDLFEPLARTIAVLGIPWYNVIGNHDINYDAHHDSDSDESFERVFGPAYYSFDHGPVHFIVLDDIEWLVDDGGEGSYQGGLGKRQMEFIRNDLTLLPENQLVVLFMHIPLMDVRDRHELYRLIEKRPFCLSVSAHMHVHQHRLITHADGWRGPEPHHHVVNVTVSGSWWSGMRDERRIPHTLMADGAPNGYSLLKFDGQKYDLEFRAAGRRPDYQMEIRVPELIETGDNSSQDVWVNVFNGSPRTEVRLQLDDESSIVMQPAHEVDPGYQLLFDDESRILEAVKGHPGLSKDVAWPALPKPRVSLHLWRHTLDTSNLSAGTHRLKVTARLSETQTVTGHRLFRVGR